jgi:hypothetical protein
MPIDSVVIDGAVVRCPAPVRDLADAPHSGVLWRAARGTLLFEVPGVARYLVRDGNLVEIDPCDGADDGEVQRFVRMTPAAALYLQRGVPVLHAAAAADPAGRAVLLAGDSGSGKSVLLTALMRRGWGLLTDDLAPVMLDGGQVPVAVPTWPEVSQWHGCAAPADGARFSDLAGTFVRQPRPIGAIWWLDLHGFDPVEVRDVEGTARLDALRAMAYNGLIASALLDRASYLRVAGAVAGSGIPIRRLIRPRGRWTAGELADVVEAAAYQPRPRTVRDYGSVP